MRSQIGPTGAIEHAASLTALFEQRHGVACIDAVAAVEGISRGAVRKRITRKDLVEVLPGVVAAHRVLSRRGWWHAADLWCATDHALGWWTAAAARDLLPERGAAVHVIAEGQPRSRHPVRVHRTGALDPADVDDVDGLPVVRAELLVVQLAPDLSDTRLADLIHRADSDHLLDDRRIAATLERHANAPGIARTRAAFAGSSPGERLNGSLEVAMPPVIRAAGVPPPAHNALVLGFVVDLWFADVGLVVELDGWEEHGRKRRTFREDRRRDRVLKRAGFDHERMTWEDVVLEPLRAAQELRGLHRASAVTFAARRAHHPELRARTRP